MFCYAGADSSFAIWFAKGSKDRNEDLVFDRNRRPKSLCPSQKEIRGFTKLIEKSCCSIDAKSFYFIKVIIQAVSAIMQKKRSCCAFCFSLLRSVHVFLKMTFIAETLNTVLD